MTRSLAQSEANMASFESTPLILFPGLAADANVFAPQKIAFPQLVVPKWPLPLPSDTLDSYCDRLAEDLRSQSGAIIGGASFGGIIALHVAQRLKPRAVLLIGSLRSASEHPRVTRLCRPLKPLVPWIPVRFLQLCSAPLTSKLARRTFPHLSGLAQQFYSANPAVFKWSLARILDWDSTPAVDCPVFRIHGDRDFILPIRGKKPDTVVRGGGHVISLTHPSEVNEFIRSAILQTADKSCG
jgi:pimeloyl-ACP methyl ester carboxylesterase